MGFSLSKAVGHLPRVVSSPFEAVARGDLPGVILDPTKHAYKGFGLDQIGDQFSTSRLFGDEGGKTTPADPEARELKQMQLDALRRFRERADEDVGGLIGKRIEAEDVAAKAAEEDAKRALRARVAQQGLGRSSIGMMAEAEMGRQSARERALARASASERADKEKERRLAQFGSAIGGQQIPFRFEPVKEESFAKQLLRGFAGGAAQGFGRGAGQYAGKKMMG